MTPTRTGENGNQAFSCLTCGERFVFTARERVFYDERVLVYPKHCPDCRIERRKTWGDRRPTSAAMAVAS